MSRKQTITFPEELHAKLSKAAMASGFSFNRYVIQRLGAKSNVVFVNLQELIPALIRLQQIVSADKHCLDEYMRLEVDQLCRFCVSFLVQTIKTRG